MDVLEQAAGIGAVQVHFSGGEPLARPDLEVLVAAATRFGLYSNLITSGIGLDTAKAAALAQAGLAAVQLSVQAAESQLADRIAGFKAHAHKLSAARAVREAGMALTMNTVLHRLNIDEVQEIVDLCVSLGAQRLELANAQYYGWALVNRAHLMPTRAQLIAAETACSALREELRGRLELVWVLSDYYERRPKPCMGGWGRTMITITPDGSALPCPAASAIGTLAFDSVRQQPLDWIWEHSPAFEAYRGVHWMREPCRTCARRDLDFGGCRCQAYLLTGDAANPDPVCDLSEGRVIVDAALDELPGATSLRYRSMARSMED